jgi:hypothetical protein
MHTIIATRVIILLQPHQLELGGPTNCNLVDIQLQLGL